MKKLPKIIVILGPTASGKTELAIKLAKKFNGEIVNADSRSIYKGMYIGTASPLTSKKLQTTSSDKVEDSRQDRYYKLQVHGVRHHLFHFVKSWKVYTVGEYKKDSIRVINDIVKRGKVPILVGGTGLYIWAIVDNLEIPEVSPQLKLRRKLEARIKKQGLLSLWKELMKLDPEAAKFVQKDNPRRVIRALEIILTTGKKFSELRKIGDPLFNVLQIGINKSRTELYKNVNTRVDKQIKEGLVEETKKNYFKIYQNFRKVGKKIRRNRYSNVLENIGIANKQVWGLPSMTGLGYRQIGMYLRGEISLETAVEILKRDTRRYSRRQFTWFRRDRRIVWVKRLNDANKLIKKFYRI